jgi:hypothetical protein
LNWKEIYDEFLLVEGAILGPTRFAFCSLDMEAKASGLFIGQMFVFANEEWSRGPYFAMEPTSICDSPFSESEYAVLGREGDLLRIEGENTIAFKLGDPKVPGPLRRVRRLGRSLFIVGEERSVWRFNGSKSEKLNSGLPAELPANLDGNEEEILDRAISGTELSFAVTQGPGDELCMVATGGEIWLWRNNHWVMDAIPTNACLFDVIYSAEGKYIVVGQLGTMLVGTPGAWSFWETGTDDDLLSVCQFLGTTYVATGNGLMFWNGEELKAVEFGTKLPVPAHQVVCGHGVLLSIAAKEVMMTTDGKVWRSLLVVEE